MSYLSVSGLSGNEDDALQRLMSGGGNASAAGKNPFLEAMEMTVGANPQQEEETPKEKVGQTEAKKGTTPSQQAASKSESVAASISTRAPQVVAPKKAFTPKVYEGDSTTSAFQADNPTDIDQLPPLEELVHAKLRRPLTETMNISQLTRIQKLSWKAMGDRETDVLVRSETGSGKTLAYALPVIHRLLCDCDAAPISRDVGTVIVVMCPTRELVLQVTDTLTTLLRCAQFLTVGGIHGGENRHKEKARLRKGMPILVTTPGRLLDHLKATSSFNVANVQTIIMDEADRLLDLGFEKPIREIMDLFRTKAKNVHNIQRILVSATITDGVERLSHFALRKKVARIGETQDTFSIPATLKQHYVSVPMKHRLAVLIGFLRSQLDAGANKIVVFVSTADCAEFLYFLLSRLDSPFTKHAYEGKIETRKTSAKSSKKMMELANQHIYEHSDEVVTFDAESDDDGDEAENVPLSKRSAKSLLDVNVFKLHGNMTQVDRASVFHAFKFGTSKTKGGKDDKGVLFCTDVAARGLDMPRIDWIVHYDPPTDPASYIHRIGRTARIGNSGDSILFLAPHEVGYAEYLTNFIQSQQSDGAGGNIAIEEKKYERFLFYLTKLDPRSNHMWINSTATLERAICRLVMALKPEKADPKDDLGRIALFAYQSYMRAYAGISKNLKNLFFQASELHLGHVAQSFGIDKSPSEVQRQLQSYIRADRVLSRDNRKGTGTFTQDPDSTKRKRQRIELEHDSHYHSMLAQKQRKVTRDYIEKRREESTRIKPLQFSEFDA